MKQHLDPRFKTTLNASQRLHFLVKFSPPKLAKTILQLHTTNRPSQILSLNHLNHDLVHRLTELQFLVAPDCKAALIHLAVHKCDANMHYTLQHKNCIREAILKMTDQVLLIPKLLNIYEF